MNFHTNMYSNGIDGFAKNFRICFVLFTVYNHFSVKFARFWQILADLDIKAAFLRFFFSDKNCISSLKNGPIHLKIDM